MGLGMRGGRGRRGRGGAGRGSITVALEAKSVVRLDADVLLMGVLLADRAIEIVEFTASIPDSLENRGSASNERSKKVAAGASKKDMLCCNRNGKSETKLIN